MAPSPTMRRLLKETSELSATSKNPNPAFHAAPVSDTDLHEWHFTLLGPPAPSPYAGGLYHGRISLPPSYPLKPPNFRFLTPSGRFEVNREICLSISGFHEETWMPAWGVRTALTALRSFMAESGTAGQVGGLEASRDVRERLARESRGWRCAECGGRTNEDLMKEWWEACVDRGVKVGEDVGLEVLPEGMKLEAKTPGGSGSGLKGEDKGKEKARDEVERELAVNSSNTQAILHDGQAGAEQANQSPVATTNASSHSSPSSPQIQSPSTHPIPTPSSPTISSSPHKSSPSTSSNAPNRPIPESPRQHPTTNLPPPTTQAQEEQNTITIDRAIYVVCAALLIMVLKKIFYPAGSRNDWEDYTSLRE